MKTSLTVALALLLLAPSGAAAAMTPSRDTGTQTITVTGDDGADALVIGVSSNLITHNIPPSGNLVSANDWDPVTAGEQGVLSSNNPGDAYVLQIAMGGGDDAVTIAAGGLEGVNADLGAGHDSFSGGATSDTITGGDGNDRIAGGPGVDSMLGGEGDDTLVWNNGDGSDTIDGEGGASDTAEVNGSPAQPDNFVVRPESGRLRIDRTNLGPFFLLVATTTERAQVNGLGGDDKVETVGSAGVALGLYGGPGADRLIGGEAADILDGGLDDDALIGGSGDDILAGDAGSDAVSGGDGNDRMVWDNGDGSDTVDGETGFDVMEVNGAGEGDAFTVRPNGDRTQFERTNLGPFGISLTADALDLNMLGGNDTFSAADGTALLIDADGGTGDDALTGGNGRDVLRGGAGNDAITGGAGSDALEGEDGDDTIAAQDGALDIVGCGAGTDRASLDAGDPAADCETADRLTGTPAPGTTGAAAPVVRILTARAKVSKRRATLKLECVGTAACSGTIVLSTAKAVKVGRARVVVVLGSAKYSIAAGRTADVRVTLTRSLAVIAGRKKKSLKARAVAGAVGRNVTLTRGKRW